MRSPSSSWRALIHLVIQARAGRPLMASAGAAGFVLVFPTFVGMVTSALPHLRANHRDRSALEPAPSRGSLLALLHRSTGPRLVAVCAAAGFSMWIRIPARPLRCDDLRSSPRRRSSQRCVAPRAARRAPGFRHGHRPLFRWRISCASGLRSSPDTRTASPGFFPIAAPGGERRL